VTGGRQVDQAPSRPNECRNPVDQDQVAQVIRPELPFASIGCVAKRCGHHSGIGDDHVERFSLFQQLIGARRHARFLGWQDRVQSVRSFSHWLWRSLAPARLQP
jgi:hypothetical protein